MDWSKLLSKKRLRRSNITDIRNEFESDFGRIIFSPALRRMHDKTQVFPLTSDDNIHSRLTHSNEVMSIGYTFGLKLSKSKLIQARTQKGELQLIRELPVLLQNICLIHDIGNAPFGHFGETIISNYFKQLEDEGQENFINLDCHQKRDFLDYDGNAQGFRVLNKLQFLDNPFGLNLTYATLAAYLKYPNYDETNKTLGNNLKSEGKILSDKQIERSKHGIFYSELDYFNRIIGECGLIVDGKTIRHPLCYLMEAADSIAYLCMDMEDGFNKGLFGVEYIRNCFQECTYDLALDIIKICNDINIDPNTKIVNIRIKLISYFVDLAYKNFESNLDSIEKGTYNTELIHDDENKIYKILRSICKNKIFNTREINFLETTGYSVIKGLLDHYICFVFEKDSKFIDKAERLISKSTIECAIDEKLISICESKIGKLLEENTRDLLKFALEESYIEELELKKTELKEIEIAFNKHGKIYTHLFNKQFEVVLSSEEKNELKKTRMDIYKLIKPEFADLDDYFKFRVILDFISGMTDQYALNHFQKISGQKIR